MNPKQIQKISRYWEIIDKLQYKIAHYNWSKFKTFEEISEIDKTVYNFETYQHYTMHEYELLNAKLDYFEEEYAKYIHKLGYQLKDKSQNEQLYQLLNNGINLFN